MPTPRSVLAFIILCLAFTAPALAAEEKKEKEAPPYTRCGGKGWRGPTKCIGEPEWSCVHINDGDYECLPLAAPTAAPTAPQAAFETATSEEA